MSVYYTKFPIKLQPPFQKNLKNFYTIFWGLFVGRCPTPWQGALPLASHYGKRTICVQIVLLLIYGCRELAPCRGVWGLAAPKYLLPYYNRETFDDGFAGEGDSGDSGVGGSGAGGAGGGGGKVED